MMMRNYLIGTQLPLTARRYVLVSVTRRNHQAPRVLGTGTLASLPILFVLAAVFILKSMS